MAISFSGSDYLSVADSGLADETILITAWGYIGSDNGVTNTLAFAANSAGNGGFGLTAAMGAVNNPTRATKYNASGGSGSAALNTTPTATWFAGAAYFETNTSRYVYRAGTRSAQGTTSVTDPAPDTLSIGARINSTVADYLTGRAAEVAIYTGITLAEADAIHAAQTAIHSPLLCPRADAIYEYWPLINAANLQGLIRGLTLSATGSPASVAHPRIIRPSARIYSFPSSAAAGLSIAVAPDAVAYAESAIGVGLGVGITVNPDALTFAEQTIGVEIGGALAFSVTPDAVTYAEQSIGVAFGLVISVSPDSIQYSDQTLSLSFGAAEQQAPQVHGGIYFREEPRDWRAESAKGRREFIRKLVDALDDDELPPAVERIVEKQIKPKLDNGRVTAKAVMSIDPAVLDRLEALIEEFADDERAAEMLLL